MGALEKVPGKQNWIDHLPGPMKAAWNRSIIYRAAVHMHRERGMSVGHAIASAINWARHIVKTGDVKQWKGPQTVNPKSVAECVAALALWESMKAAARAQTSIPAGDRRTVELTMRALDLAATPAVAGRRRLASEGKAIPDDGVGGRFPVRDRADLLKAILAFGRAKPGDRAKVKRHIVARARALGASAVLPNGWT